MVLVYGLAAERGSKDGYGYGDDQEEMEMKRKVNQINTFEENTAQFQILEKLEKCAKVMKVEVYF